MGVAAAFKQMQVNGKLARALAAGPWRRDRAPRRRLWVLGFAVGFAVAVALVWSALRERSHG